MKKIILTLLSCYATISVMAQAGQLDSTFNNDGIVTYAPSSSFDIAHRVVALADTTSIIGGVSYAGGGGIGFLMHLNQDGSQDMSFGTGGMVSIQHGLETYGYALKVDNNGKILIAGIFYDAVYNGKIFIDRFHANGQIDSTFNGVGSLELDVNVNEEICNSMVIDNNGKIILAGSANGNQSCLFARVNSNGTLDTTFGANGFRMVDYTPAGSESINEVRLLSSGTIVGAGYGYNTLLFGDVSMLVKLNGDGDVVTNFGVNGVVFPAVSLNMSTYCSSMDVKNDELFLTGYMNSNNAAFVAKVDSNGAMMNSFGTQGKLLITPYAVNFSNGIKVLNDNKILICGQTGPSGFMSPKDYMVARIDPSGILDINFGNNGLAIHSASTGDDLYDLDIQPDGKIIASGLANFGNNDIAVLRYKNTGTSIPTHVSAPSETAIKIYPNPVSNVVHLVFPSINNQTRSIQLIDMAGKVIFQRSLAPGHSTYTLPMMNLTAGNYFIRTDNQHILVTVQ